jgi:catechol 2,3-dioxygenase-like lactoylglutathione lyase family enzyme
MRLLRAATLTTPDPHASAARYAQWFGHRLVETGTVSAALAAGWGAPAMAGRGYAVVQPPSGAEVYLRFVQAPAAPGYTPLRSFGWAAIELCVADVLATHARLRDSPFAIIGPPKALDGAPSIWPMQVQGPDREIIFLTEIRADAPGARLPRAACPVDRLFIAVLACRELAVTRAWFEAKLGFTGGPDFTLAYTTLSRAFGLPAEHPHRIGVLGHDGDAFLQLDQYPAAAAPREVLAGELPPGVAMVSFAMPGLTGGPRHAGVIYGGADSAVWRTPEGALAEVIA